VNKEWTKNWRRDHREHDNVPSGFVNEEWEPPEEWFMDRRNSNTEKAAFSEEQQSSHPVRLQCCGVINEAPEHLHFSG